jgi:UDP-glucose 4-epimerase
MIERKSKPVRCLVVGGAGFIGSQVSNILAETGRVVIALGRSSSPLHQLSNKVKYVSGDYKDRLLLRELLKDTDELIDLAYATVPKTSFDDPVNDILSNLPAGVGLIQEATQAKLRKVVFVSSGGTVYGIAQSLPIFEDHPTNPISPYGITKLTLEKYVLMFASLTGLPASIVRPGNAYGEHQLAFSGQGFVATAIKSILLRQPVNIFGSHGTIRDYLHVEDLAQGIVAALQFGLVGDVYNIGSGIGLNNMDVLEVIEPFARSKGYSFPINILPERGFDVPANVLNSEKLTNLSSWQPKIKFTDGILRTWMGSIEKN